MMPRTFMKNQNSRFAYHSGSLFFLILVVLTVFRIPLLTHTMPLHTDGQFMTYPALAYFKAWALKGSYPVWWITDSITGNMADTGSVGPAWLLFTPFLFVLKIETAWFLHFIFMYAMAGICMYFYLHEMTQQRFASLFGAVLFMRAEWVVDCLVEPQIQLFMVPLIFSCAEKTLETRKMRFILLASVLSALLFLGSNAHYPLYLVPLTVVYYFVRAFQKWRSNSRSDFRFFIYGLLQIQFFMALVWFRGSILSTVMMNSTRDTLAKTVPVFLSPASALGFVFPDLFNAPSVEFPHLYNRILQGISLALTGHEIRLLDVWYPGLFAVFFLFVSFSFLKQMPWILPHWIALIAVSFYMMGGEALLFPLIQKLPVLNMVSNNQRISVITTVVIPILAATGLAGCSNRQNQGIFGVWVKRFFFFFAVLALLFALKAAAVFTIETFWKESLTQTILNFIQTHPGYIQSESFYRARIDEFFRWFVSWANWRDASVYLPFLLYTLGALLFWFRSKSKKSSFGFGAIFLLVLLWDGFVAHPLPFNTLVSRNQAYPETPAVQFLKQDSSLFRYLSLKTRNDPPFPLGHAQFLPSDKGMVHGLASVHGYQAITSKRYAQIYQTLAKLDSVNSIRLHDLYEYDDALADLLNVKYIAVAASETLPGETLVFSDTNYHLYENKNFFPRAFLVPNSIPVKDITESFSIIQKHSMDYRKSVLLEGPDAPGFSTGSLTDRDRVTILRYKPHKIKIEVEAANTRILVVSDAYHPAWSALVDGRKTTLYIANHAFRGVVVPPGKHLVVLRLYPFSYSLYATLLLLSLGLFGIVWLYYRRKS